MIRKVLISFVGLMILAFAGCGKKEAAGAATDVQEMSEMHEAGRSLSAIEASSHGADMTKASSQGAAAKLEAGVFARAAAGDPEAVYLARCQYCHIQLGPGTITLAKRYGPEEALLANRTDLNADYVKVVVRNGLNTMPAISRVEVSDAELELIADYLAGNK